MVKEVATQSSDSPFTIHYSQFNTVLLNRLLKGVECLLRLIHSIRLGHSRHSRRRNGISIAGRRPAELTWGKPFWGRWGELGSTGRIRSKATSGEESEATNHKLSSSNVRVWGRFRSVSCCSAPTWRLKSPGKRATRRPVHRRGAGILRELQRRAEQVSRPPERRSRQRRWATGR